ncbi:MAG: dTDP-glucose 4,6-dehydratase [Deltaproteobacteria bacterium]|nr:dTDP-glucose 4,6-dehydratase [Deltaproteobacteria bacterium]
MNVLVTGGCGFIGSNFIHHLFRTDPEVLVVNLDKLTYAGNPRNLETIQSEFGGTRYFFVRGDIGDAVLVPALLRHFKIRGVINFAAESHVDRSISDPAPFLTTNVNGTQNLLECARRHGVDRFLQVSTDEVYGTLGPSGKFTESTPLAPNSPYSASKASADLVVRAYFETYKLPVIITRCTNNYGPYQFPEKLIPLAFLKARANRKVPVYGRGVNVRDWIHVLDHCRGVDLAFRSGRDGEVYNFGGGCELQNIDVVRAILDHLGRSHDLISYVEDRPGHDLRYAIDFAKAESELGWRPEKQFTDALAETLDWYEANPVWLENVQTGAYRKFMDQWYEKRS